MTFTLPNKFAKSEGHPCCEKTSGDTDGTAGECVLRALADEDAEIHRTLHDNDVGQRERKEEENAYGGEDDPLRDVLAYVGLTDERDDGEDKERREADRCPCEQNAEAAARIAGCGTDLWGQAGKEIRDGEKADDGFEGVDSNGVGNQPVA